MTISHQQFVEQLLTEFPEIRDEVTDEAGLLHLEMSCFARRTQKAIDEENRADLKRCFDFASRVLENADPDVENAVIVSYLENLDFRDGERNHNWAIEMMHPALKDGLDELNRHMEELAKRMEELPKRKLW